MMHPKKDEETLDLRERGKDIDGQPQLSDRRLYMQLHVFDNCPDPTPLIEPLKASGLDTVLYADMNNPAGVGVVTMAESPDVFVREARCLFSHAAFSGLQRNADFTMIGRTYAHGYEPDLEDTLLHKPRRKLLGPDCKWAIWYPLRRKAEFGLLEGDDLRKILGEHARIGRTYAESGYAQDIRLACYGLDRDDNDFVIGLLGAELYPLSRVVQEMRKTQQTATYVQSLGPFFVGRTVWQSESKT
ncbi:MAG: chlorite dismutase family protein [bacterium]|nr:chlorite dismutase family protein [bacterium]